MSLFGKIWWLFWGIVGTVCGTLLFIYDKEQRLKWGGGTLVAVMILMTVIGGIRNERKEKRKTAGGSIKEKAGALIAKASAEKEKGFVAKIRRHKKAFFILILSVAAALAAFFLFAPSSAPRGTPVAEFDFPVWALRDGNVAVFEKQILYGNASKKYIVVANVGDEPQTDIPVYDKVPVGIAECVAELTFTVLPEVENARDPAILKFTVDSLAPQTSKVFTIASPNGSERMIALCKGAGGSDCSASLDDTLIGLQEETRTKYQSEADPVTAVIDGAAQNLTAEQAAFYEKVKTQSERIITEMKSAEPRGILASVRAKIDGTKAWILSLNDKIKESMGSNASDEKEDAPPEPVKTTSLTAETFPKEVTEAFVLAKTEDINRLDFHCKKTAPLKAMVAAYTIPEAYRRGMTPGKKTSQKVEVGVYATAEEALEAGKACGRGLYRLVTAKKVFPGWLWRDGSEDLITNPWVAYVGRYKNYLIYAPVEAMQFAVDAKLFPAIAEEIKKGE